MSQSLAVKYRPKLLSEVVEQESVIKILTRQLETGDLQHCYLFSGVSGSGKSTSARAFAYAVNEGVGQPIEIDAASNSGVDNVRAIIKEAYERSVAGEYKIYILDEVQGFSSTAWQALLKTIEEPPEHTIFIFCTTDPQKIPNTILNRVQRFNFHKISMKGIQSRLKYVCDQEGLNLPQDSLDYLSKVADGCMRDALTMLDKCVDYNSDLCLENILTALGNNSYQEQFQLLNALIDGDEKRVLQQVEGCYERGNDLKVIIDQFLSFCLDVSKYALFQSCDLLQIPASFEEELKNATNFEAPEKYYSYLVDKLLDLKLMLKGDTNIKAVVEVVMLRIARCQ